jgi:hypothetical protein
MFIFLISLLIAAFSARLVRAGIIGTLFWAVYVIGCAAYNGVFTESQPFAAATGLAIAAAIFVWSAIGIVGFFRFLFGFARR